jgi:hypothetical protein
MNIKNPNIKPNINAITSKEMAITNKVKIVPNTNQNIMMGDITTINTLSLISLAFSSLKKFASLVVLSFST